MEAHKIKITILMVLKVADTSLRTVAESDKMVE